MKNKFLKVGLLALLGLTVACGGNPSSVPSNSSSEGTTSETQSSATSSAGTSSSSSSSSSSSIGTPEPEVEATTLDALADSAPTQSFKVIYEVTGVWVPTGAETDKYGNGYLVDPVSGKKLVIWGMAGSKDKMFTWNSGTKAYNQPENPKEFQTVKTNFAAGDKIKLGVSYTTQYANYYSYFIEKVTDKSEISYNLSVTAGENGSATLSTETGTYGQEITVNITPDAGYKVASVNLNGAALPADESGVYKFEVSPLGNHVEVEFIGENVQATSYELTPDFLGKSYAANDAETTATHTFGTETVELKYVDMANYGTGIQSKINNDTKVAAYLYNSTAFSGEIESVQIIRNSKWTSAATNKAVWSISFGTEAITSKPTEFAGTYTKDSADTVTCNVEGAKYFRIDHTTAGAVYVDKIIVTYKAAPVAVAGVEVTQDDGQNTVFVGHTLPLTATVTPAEAENTAVEWTTSDATKATVDENGVVTGVAEGTVTITATSKENADISDSIELTVATLVSDKDKVTSDANDIELASEVTEDFTLPTTGANGSTITWSVKEGTAIEVEGETAKVTQPSFDQGDATVTLTASLSLNGETTTRDITVTVKKLAYATVAQALNLAEGTAVVVRGVVTELDDQGYDQGKKAMSLTIKDSAEATESLYVYKLATKVFVGDVIEITGTMGAYNGNKQVSAGATATAITKAPALTTVTTTVAGLDELNYETPVKVKGTVTKIDGAWNSDYKNMNVTIDDGTGTVQLYRVGLELTVGQVVEAEGLFCCYNGTEQVSNATGTILSETVEVESVTAKESSFELKVGQSRKIEYTIAPSNTTTRSATFASDNLDVATVDETTGLVTAVSEGTANITITAGDKSTVVTVTVVQGSNEELVSKTVTLTKDSGFQSDKAASEGGVTGSFTVDGIEFGYKGCQNNGGGYIMMHAKSTDSYIYNINPLGEKIESVAITCNTGSVSGNAIISCSFGTSVLNSKITTGETVKQAAGLAYTFYPTSDSTYFNISGAAKYNIQFKQIVITYASGATATL